MSAQDIQNKYGIRVKIGQHVEFTGTDGTKSYGVIKNAIGLAIVVKFYKIKGSLWLPPNSVKYISEKEYIAGKNSKRSKQQPQAR